MLSQSRRPSKSSRLLNTKAQHKKLVFSHSPSTPTPSSKLTLISPRSRLTRLKNPVPELPPQKTLLHIPNESIRKEFQLYPIHIEKMWIEKENSQKQSVITISKIDQFSDQYSTHFDAIYSCAYSVLWIILSRAVNNQQIQSQFNDNYHPIVFKFVPTLCSALNVINYQHFKKAIVQFNWFKNIINFEAYQNQSPAIIESYKQMIKDWPTNQNQLWLINQEDLQSLQHNPKNNYVFINQQQIKSNKIQILVSDLGMTYILLKQHDKILSQSIQRRMEWEMEQLSIKSNLLASQNIRYCLKLANNYLNGQTVFSLIDFPESLIHKFYKEVDFILALNKKIQISTIKIFNIYYSKKDPFDVFGQLFNRQNRQEEEIRKIKHNCQALLKLERQYQQMNQEIINTTFAIFHIQGKQQLHREIQKFTHKKVQIIEEINSLFHSDEQNMMLLGQFSKLQKQTLSKIESLTLLELSRSKQDTKIIHHQIILALEKAVKLRRDNLKVNPRVLSFNFILEEFRLEKRYLYKPIKQFRQVLSRVQAGCHHIILMEMEDYTEQRQGKISQIQILKQVTFEIYLKYGNDFISRNKSNKYHFFKREQLVSKIKEVCLLINSEESNQSIQSDKLDRQENYHQKNFSDIFQISHTERAIRYLSTPNLREINRQIFIIIPKTIPFHSLANRSEQPYSLLIYSHLQQVHFFTKHLSQGNFAMIIVDERDSPLLPQIHKTQYFEYNTVNKLGEKEIRQQIDKMIDRIGLVRKQGVMIKSKKAFPSLILYENNDKEQKKTIHQMNTFFKQSKVLTISKEQFGAIKAKYVIQENLNIFEMGYLQFSATTKVKNIYQLFKIYMAPNQSPLEFNADHIHFSNRQLFIKQYFQYIKKGKFNKRLQEVNRNKSPSLKLNRAISPKSRSFRNIEFFISQPEIVILQSINISKIIKSQKFNNLKHLISLAFTSLNKGNTLLVIVNQDQYEHFQKKATQKIEGIIWIVIVNNPKHCIIREDYLVYCLKDHLEATLIQISLKFKTFKKKQFRIDNSQLSFTPTNNSQNTISVIIQNKWSIQQKAAQDSLKTDYLKIISDNTIKELNLLQLGSSIISKKSQKVQSFINMTSNIRQTMKENSQYHSNQYIQQIHPQIVYLVLQERNVQFIHHCLKIIQETNFLMITFIHVEQLLLYSQIQKSIVLLQKIDGIVIGGCLCVQGSDTPTTFSPKLRTFIESVRKST